MTRLLTERLLEAADRVPPLAAHDLRALLEVAADTISRLEEELVASRDEAAVQGEPVAVMYEDGTVLTKADCGDSFATCCKVQTPLYTAPQPVGHLNIPVFARRMDEELEKHDISGFEPVILAVAEEVLGIEQQPAPDMRGLTEALRQYQHNDGSGLVFGYDRLLVDQYVAGLVEALEGLLGVIGESRGVSGYHLNGEIAEWDEFQAVHDATAALAAHRQQEDSPCTSTT